MTSEKGSFPKPGVSCGPCDDGQRQMIVAVLKYTRATATADFALVVAVTAVVAFTE